MCGARAVTLKKKKRVAAQHPKPAGHRTEDNLGDAHEQRRIARVANVLDQKLQQGEEPLFVPSVESVEEAIALHELAQDGHDNHSALLALQSQERGGVRRRNTQSIDATARSVDGDALLRRTHPENRVQRRRVFERADQLVVWLGLFPLGGGNHNVMLPMGHVGRG